MVERHTIETYGPQPNNRNRWQTGRRHAWPILLSAFQTAFIPLLVLAAFLLKNCWTTKRIAARNIELMMSKVKQSK